MSNLDRGPSKDASYQDLISEEKIFLEINQSEKRIVYGGYKDCSFHPDLLTNMTATGDSCF
jgi:hypothetical protein